MQRIGKFWMRRLDVGRVHISLAFNPTIGGTNGDRRIGMLKKRYGHNTFFTLRVKDFFFNFDIS